MIRILQSFISWRDLFKTFNPTEESLNNVSLFINILIKFSRSTSLFLFSISRVNGNIALDASSSVVVSYIFRIKSGIGINQVWTSYRGSNR